MTIAPIIQKTVNKICFSVDSVTPCLEPLPLQSAKLQIEKVYEKPLLAFSHNDLFKVVHDERGIHPLALAVHYAFSYHRPLLLTPDMIWILLAQGFAQHINNCAEELRYSFVKHSGKEELVVETNKKPSEPSEYAEFVEQLVLVIRDFVGADIYRLMECNFSTTTPIIRTTSHIVMMDAFKEYFRYELNGLCGIPNITFLGTVADWQNIYERVKFMGHYKLRWWTDRILPICEEFIKTAAGNPNQKFWQSIYKPEKIYSNQGITGWLVYLFPYLQDAVTKQPLHQVKNLPDVRNHILDIPLEELTVEDHIRLADLPSGLSRAEFKYKEGLIEEQQELIAGFIGLCQHPDTGILCPEIGWGVRDGDKFLQVLNDLKKKHHTNPPINWSDDLFYRYFGCREILQLLKCFDGAILFANSKNPWYILQAKDYKRCYVFKSATNFNLFNIIGECTSFINLKDGRCIAYVGPVCSDGFLTLSGILVGKPFKYPFEEEAIGLKETKVIAVSILQFFERVLASSGKSYFDEPNFIPDQSLRALYY